ncbi:MAG: MBL fold metallo-hydrolase [Anaerolineae bacterium]|nr:MBL fold metallo-hydrolase [Anaerolineae bacterium]
MTNYLHHFQVGDFKCVSITDFDREVKVDSIFSNRTPEEHQQVLSEYLETGLPNAINILYIDTGDHRVLVDSSIGGERSNLLARLDDLGVKPEDIDRIIITHGHGDHVDGLVDLPNDRLVFPNARYAVNPVEWTYWTDEAKSKNTITPVWRILSERITDRQDFCAPGDEILPGIQAVDAHGHTVGQIALLIESAGERLLHIADVAHHPFQIQHPDWSPRFDSDPLVAAETRQVIFERADREHLPVIAYHFPRPGLGRVRGQQWEPVG